MSGSIGDAARHPRRPTLTPALSRSELDRDYLTRLNGVTELLADPRTRLVVLHEGRALGSEQGALTLLDPAALAVEPDAVVFLGRARSASRSEEHTSELQ